MCTFLSELMSKFQWQILKNLNIFVKNDSNKMFKIKLLYAKLIINLMCDICYKDMPVSVTLIIKILQRNSDAL